MQDANGQPLKVGDEIMLRAVVTDVTETHVLTRAVVGSKREYWFMGGDVEKTASAFSLASVSHVEPVEPQPAEDDEKPSVADA